MSGHFDDFGPERQLGGPVQYAATMRGPGRWSTLFADDVTLGVLWTNDADALALWPLEGADDDTADDVRDLISAAAARGLPAADTFDGLAATYPGELHTGNLAELHTLLLSQ